MPRSRSGGRLSEMSEFVKSDGVRARVGGTRLEEFGFYATDTFKNLEKRRRRTLPVTLGSVQHSQRLRPHAPVSPRQPEPRWTHL
jgi:hypothetical protein